MEEKKNKENEYFPYSTPMGNCKANGMNNDMMNLYNKSDNDITMPWQEMPKNRKRNGKGN